MGFKMHAYAQARVVRAITINSIAETHISVSEDTPSGNGSFTRLGTVFKNMRTPAPFNFTWMADKYIPATLFTSLRHGEEFELEMSIAETDPTGRVLNRFDFNFYQCKFIKARIGRGGKVKVDATYGVFRMTP